MLLQSLNPLKQLLDHLEILTSHKVLFPTIIDRGSRIGMYSKRRDHIRGIEPLRTPVLNRINQIITKKEIFLPLAKLNATTTQWRSIVTPGVWLQTKKVMNQGD
jgi:hypothetical protein